MEQVGYAARRPYVVAASLGDLSGPTRGHVRLPEPLGWTGRAEYDLDDEADRAVFYERVLVEATTPDELSRSLDGALLRTLWGRLFLPAALRHAWEQRFAGLAATARTA
jgi:hypothetical protein